MSDSTNGAVVEVKINIVKSIVENDQNQNGCYCMSCRKPVSTVLTLAKKNRRGAYMCTGKCPNGDHNVYQVVGAADVEKNLVK